MARLIFPGKGASALECQKKTRNDSRSARSLSPFYLANAMKIQREKQKTDRGSKEKIDKKINRCPLLESNQSPPHIRRCCTTSEALYR